MTNGSILLYGLHTNGENVKQFYQKEIVEMPIYEYLCPDCACIREIIQLKEEAVNIRCPDCGNYMGKVMSAPALVYKLKEAGEDATK